MYERKNWNAVILYNYVHEAINRDDLSSKRKTQYSKDISDVKGVLENKLDKIHKYYKDYYQEHFKNDDEKLNRLLNSLEGNLNNAVNDIQKYVNALKLNESLYEFKKIKLAYKKKKSIENLAPYLDDSSSSSSEVVEVWAPLVLTDKKDTNKSYLFYPTIAYDNNQLYIVELSRTVQRWEKSNKQGSMEQISIDSSKIKDLDGLKDHGKLLLDRLDGLVKLPTEELWNKWHQKDKK
ncbi:MAG: hypothetical protein II453_13645 [Alphaproteobacteria bacterium]|nr:hypothetical protein [Alphaproteobacteria bacterium]